MQYTYILTNKDFVNYYLYTSLNSKLTKSRRQRNKYLIPAMSLVAFIISILAQDFFYSAITMLIGVIWYFFYPKWELTRYSIFYKKSLKEQMGTDLNEEVKFEFQDDYIFLKDAGSESKIYLTELTKITEIESNIFIKIRKGNSILISKNTLNNLKQFEEDLQIMASKLNIFFDKELDWKSN